MDVESVIIQSHGFVCVLRAGERAGGVLLKLTSTSGSGAPSRPPTLLSYINSASLSEDSGRENLQ